MWILKSLAVLLIFIFKTSEAQSRQPNVMRVLRIDVSPNRHELLKSRSSKPNVFLQINGGPIRQIQRSENNPKLIPQRTITIPIDQGQTQTDKEFSIQTNHKGGIVLDIIPSASDRETPVSGIRKQTIHIRKTPLSAIRKQTINITPISFVPNHSKSPTDRKGEKRKAKKVNPNHSTNRRQSGNKAERQPRRKVPIEIISNLRKEDGRNIINTNQPRREKVNSLNKQNMDELIQTPRISPKQDFLKHRDRHIDGPIGRENVMFHPSDLLIGVPQNSFMNPFIPGMLPFGDGDMESGMFILQPNPFLIGQEMPLHNNKPIPFSPEQISRNTNTDHTVWSRHSENIVRNNGQKHTRQNRRKQQTNENIMDMLIQQKMLNAMEELPHIAKVSKPALRSHTSSQVLDNTSQNKNTPLKKRVFHGKKKPLASHTTNRDNNMSKGPRPTSVIKGENDMMPIINANKMSDFNSGKGKQSRQDHLQNGGNPHINQGILVHPAPGSPLKSTDTAETVNDKAPVRDAIFPEFHPGIHQPQFVEDLLNQRLITSILNQNMLQENPHISLLNENLNAQRGETLSPTLRKLGSKSRANSGPKETVKKFNNILKNGKLPALLKDMNNIEFTNSKKENMPTSLSELSTSESLTVKNNNSNIRSNDKFNGKLLTKSVSNDAFRNTRDSLPSHVQESVKLPTLQKHRNRDTTADLQTIHKDIQSSIDSGQSRISLKHSIANGKMTEKVKSQMDSIIRDPINNSDPLKIHTASLLVQTKVPQSENLKDKKNDNPFKEKLKGNNQKDIGKKKGKNESDVIKKKGKNEKEIIKKTDKESSLTKKKDRPKSSKTRGKKKRQSKKSKRKSRKRSKQSRKTNVESKSEKKNKPTSTQTENLTKSEKEKSRNERTTT